MKPETECPLCSHPARREPATFTIVVFVVKPTGKVGIQVWPEGMPVERCYTNDGCGEHFIDGEVAGTCDAATAKVLKDHPELLPLLEAIRQETKVAPEVP